MIALNLDTGKRVLSACKVLPNISYEGMPQVETIPEDDITNYKYLNGSFRYDPLPVPPEPEPQPTAEDDLNAMAVDHELRITMLELEI